MWNLLPVGLVHFLNTFIIIIGLVGVSAGFLGRWIPFFNTYAPLCRVVGTILLVVGVYFKGGEAVEQAWRDKVTELQQKIDIAEQRSIDATKLLDAELKRKKETAKETTQAIKDQIARNAKQLDSECRVSDAAIEIHNEAAQNKKPKVTVTFDGKITK